MAVTLAFKIKPQIAPSVTVSGQVLANVCTYLTHVACVASDGERQHEAFSFKCPVKLPDPDPATFKPDAKLTGDVLLGWATAELGQAEIDDLKARAAAGLAAMQPAPEVEGREFTAAVKP